MKISLRNVTQLRWLILFLPFIIVLSCSTDDTSTPTPQAPVFDGDVLLESQTEVDSFGAIGYSEIIGKLEIVRAFETTDPITSLSTLSTLEVIRGDLRLINMYDLMSFDGLNNIESVSGELYLYANTSVTSLEPLSNISSTIQRLEIFGHRGLTSLNGLENLSIISGGDLFIEGNDKLTDLGAIQQNLPSALSAIKFDELSFGCFSCVTSTDPIPQPFDSLDFLNNVTEIEWLRVKGFVGTTLSGLESVISIDRLSLWRNPNLINLQALSTTVSDIERVFIIENDQLETLDGLENIGEITQSLFVNQNEVLSDFCALQGNISPNLPLDQFGIDTNAFNPTLQDIVDGNCSN